MPESSSHDAIVIGTGQAGPSLAHALAGAGRRVAVVERRHVGGSCVNFGCTPTKTMIASARVAHLAGRGFDYGVRTGAVSVDLERVRERKREVVASFRDGGRRSLEEAAGIDLVFGHARFVGPKEVEVELAAGGTSRLEAPEIFLDVGTRTRRPEIEGLDDVQTHDSESLMELDELPEHLLVLGGGYIGLELGQMFRRFGSRVSVIYRGEQLLSREDEDIARAMEEALTADGMEILLDSEAVRFERWRDRIRCQVEGPSGSYPVEGSHVLLAAGRVPNTDDLGLEAAGIETDERGHVVTDERLATSVDGVYALGDVKGPPAFTHIAYDDYRVVATNLLGDGGASIRDRLVPYTVFTDPQLGRVGLTEAEAERRGEPYRLARIPMEHVARAIETGETRGLMKAVVDGETDRILGCAVLGVEGGEVMAVLQVAMEAGVAYTALRDGIFAHPTLAESLNTLFGSLEERG